MGAAKTKADKIATDHNVDDIGETVLTWLSWSFLLGT
jgi:tRNA(Ile)-lysidine synthase TilS/MesJ